MANQIIQLENSAINKAVNVVFIAAAAGGAYYLVNKVVKDARRKGAMSDLDDPNSTDGLAVTFATQFYNAMFSGPEWISDWFGDMTDEDEIYRTAGDMFRLKLPFSKVAAKYKALYGRDLLSDLQSELDSEELLSFNRMLSTGLSGIGSIPRGISKMVTKAATVVHNERLQPIQTVPVHTILGSFREDQLTAYALPDNRVMIGFMYNGAMRYVDSRTIKQL